MNFLLISERVWLNFSVFLSLSRTDMSASGTSLEPWLELSPKVVMVTGASSGLGREFCLDLAKAGCRIVAAARRIERLQSLCDEINSSFKPGGGRIRAAAVELDIGASAAAIEAAVEKAWDAFGRIDVLINNAGVRGITEF